MDLTQWFLRAVAESFSASSFHLARSTALVVRISPHRVILTHDPRTLLHFWPASRWSKLSGRISGTRCSGYFPPQWKAASYGSRSILRRRCESPSAFTLFGDSVKLDIDSALSVRTQCSTYTTTPADHLQMRCLLLPPYCAGTEESRNSVFKSFGRCRSGAGRSSRSESMLRGGMICGAVEDLLNLTSCWV